MKENACTLKGLPDRNRLLHRPLLCSNLRGLEKAECERRDTVRDDLPAGVTSTQPKKNPETKDPNSK